MDYCICGRLLDTVLSPSCADCRIDPARLQDVIALRAQIAQLERERDGAVARANRAERQRDHWRRSFYNQTSPDVFQIGV